MTAQGTSGAVGEKAGEAAEQVKQTAASMQQTVRSQALEQADHRKSKLVEPARTITREGEKIAEQLRSDGMERPAELLTTATHQVQQVVEYVERTPVEQMLGDLGTQARQKPLLFVGAAFGIGLAAARLFKAQAPQPSAAQATGARPVPQTRTRRFERGGSEGATAQLPATTASAQITQST